MFLVHQCVLLDYHLFVTVNTPTPKREELKKIIFDNQPWQLFDGTLVNMGLEQWLLWLVDCRNSQLYLNSGIYRVKLN